MNWGKLAALGYKPVHDFEAGLEETADWYRRNADRWAPLSRSPLPAMPSPRVTLDTTLEPQHV
ncbi:dTDP-D-glucose 4,6-dehydratase [Streptomyces phaeogriseichromatogenes]|nr:dTDP-D-glucose 4,6-dehydratase [Streptomyces murinus]